MKLRNLLIIAGAFVGLAAFPALADLTYTQGSGTTIFDFLCFTTKHCSAHVPINSSGAEIAVATSTKQPALGTAGASSTDVLSVQGIASGTALPVSGTFWQATQPVSGTFWQATQPVSLASVPSHAVTNAGTFATQAAVTAASGSVSSGAYAAGALAAGAFASGAGVDGWDLTQGAKADSVCGTATGTCSVVALLKYLNTSVSAAIPAGTAIIGKVGIDQTTPGTTNAVAATNLPTTVDTNSGNKSASTVRVVLATDQPAFTNKLLVTPDSVALPANQSVNINQLGGSAVYADPCKVNTPTSTPISITTATTTRIVAPTSAKKTYVCYLFLTSAAADNVAVVEGTGGTCGTGTAGVVGGTTAANGLNFAANGGAAFGNGETWAFSTAGTNVDLCLITSAATPLAGTVKWVQQ